MATALCAVALATMVAGCGSSSPPPSTGASTTGSSGGATGSFDPQLAPKQKHGGAAGGAGAQNSGEQAAGAGALVGTTSSTATSTPANTTTTPAQTQTKAATTTKPKVITRTITVTKRTPPKTVIHYVTKKVLPDVPSGAFMPSSHQALAQGRFTVPGSNIGCDLVSGGVRCDIQQRSWTPPAQPSSCNATWGNAIDMGATGVPAFACGGASAISSDAKVVPDGWDDKVGTITCQVRSFSVDCYSAHGHGFIFSRTGYTLY
jgi:hypothetical protein